MKHQLKQAANKKSVHSKRILMLLLCFIGFTDAMAQGDALSINQKVDSSLLEAIHMYDRTIGRNSFLYTGKVYVDQYSGVKGHQFFNEEYWEQSEIVYDGHHFDSVYLMYDIYNNEVLLEHFSSEGVLAPIKLYNPKISSFNIQGHTFVMLEQDSLNRIKEGFYDQLFLGDHIGVYVLRRKEIYKSTGTNIITENFIAKHKYYIKKNGIFYPVRSKGTIAKALLDRKKEIKRYLNANRLYYKEDPERTLMMAAKYYESLNE